MKPLLDEIAEVFGKSGAWTKYDGHDFVPCYDFYELDADIQKDLKLHAQAAIDVVERRLLSEDAIKVARKVSGLGFGEASDVIAETWQAVKGGDV